MYGFSSPHFCGCWNCFAIPLSQPQKRRLQPERYAKYGLKLFIKNIDKR
jgi:hypothetical protein